MAKFLTNFISYTLYRTVDITVVIPSVTSPECRNNPSHIPKADYPVLYLLHGGMNNHHAWTAYTNVEFFAEERQIAVVMMSGENKSYIDHPGSNMFDSANFFTFLSEELPEFVKAMFPISHRPEDTYVAGLSMGGYGTLVQGFNWPERYRALGVFSGGAMMPGADTGDIRFRPLDMLDNFVAEGKKLPPIYMSCGTEDDMVYEHNLMLKDKLIEAGMDVTWEAVEGYRHEWRFWNNEIEKFLDWIPRTDIYAAQGKRRI